MIDNSLCSTVWYLIVSLLFHIYLVGRLFVFLLLISWISVWLASEFCSGKTWTCIIVNKNIFDM